MACAGCGGLELLPCVRRVWLEEPSVDDGEWPRWFGSPLVAAENSDSANPGVEVAIAGDRRQVTDRRKVVEDRLVEADDHLLG